MKNSLMFLVLIFCIQSFSQIKKIECKKSFKIIQKAPTLDKGIQLRLKRVFDDSRCPEGAQCIWAGEVSVEIIVYKNKKIIELKTLTLNSKNSGENKKWFSNWYKIVPKEIVVFPTLKKNVEANPKDYFVKVIY